MIQCGSKKKKMEIPKEEEILETSESYVRLIICHFCFLPSWNPDEVISECSYSIYIVAV